MLFFLAICDGIEHAGEQTGSGMRPLVAVHRCQVVAAAQLGDIFLTRAFQADPHLRGRGRLRSQNTKR
jgi:hypothetical protein